MPSYAFEKSGLAEIEDRDRTIDEQARKIREHDETIRLLSIAANPDQVRDLEECIEAHAEAESLALKAKWAGKRREEALHRRIATLERDNAHLRRTLDRSSDTPSKEVLPFSLVSSRP